MNDKISVYERRALYTLPSVPFSFFDKLHLGLMHLSLTLKDLLCIQWTCLSLGIYLDTAALVMRRVREWPLPSAFYFWS